jgi:2-polyprenyl-3-methyl-5-hydroxy-6-metoxy-1,4-benzoquinol methylase
MGALRDNPNIEVLECTSCGLVFLSHSSHIYEGFYESSKMHNNETADIEMWLEETERDDERRYYWLGHLLENKSVLDFGCGAGGFLLRARKIASRVAGVEPEVRLISYFHEKGINIFPNIDKIDGSYDIITLFHVLEHIPDPITIMRQLSKRLNQGGQLIIETPNANDALLTLYQNEAFSHFTYWSCHLFVFTGSTLLRIAEKAGLKLNYIKQIQRYSLANHLYWLSKGKPEGHKKWHFLDSKELNKAYAKQLASLESCDTIIASFSV